MRLKRSLTCEVLFFKEYKEAVGNGRRFTKLGLILPLVGSTLLLITEIRFVLFSFIVEYILLLSG